MNRNWIQPLWKAIFTCLLIIGIIAWAAFITGCAGPVIPRSVASSSIAFDGDEHNAGVLAVWPEKGALLTDAKKLEYDALVRVYGRGSVGHRLIPPIKLGDGITRLRGADEGFPQHPVVWHFTPLALTDFILLKSWAREGRTPL